MTNILAPLPLRRNRSSKEGSLDYKNKLECEWKEEKFPASFSEAKDLLEPKKAPLHTLSQQNFWKNLKRNNSEKLHDGKKENSFSESFTELEHYKLQNLASKSSPLFFVPNHSVSRSPTNQMKANEFYEMVTRENSQKKTRSVHSWHLNHHHHLLHDNLKQQGENCDKNYRGKGKNCARSCCMTQLNQHSPRVKVKLRNSNHLPKNVSWDIEV